MFAQVAIEKIPNKLFTYRVTEGMGVCVGQKVTVPWKRIYHSGYIVALTEESPFKPKMQPPEAIQSNLFGEAEEPVKGIKALTEIVDPLPYFSATTIKLLQWLANYYDVGFTLALRSALPAPVREHGSHAQERFVVAPIVPRPKGLPQLSKRLQELYDDIVRVDGGTLTQLCAEFKTTPASLRKLATQGYVTCERTIVQRNPLAGRKILPSRPLPLTEEQAIALEGILQAKQPVLLFGVTGSGKTEVYMQAIANVLAEGKSTIMLVPEISLTPQTVNRFASRFGKTVAVLHSALSDGERHDEWHRIRRGEAQVVVGPRSAVFAPVKDLGLLIVDEEHDGGYKQDEAPRYSARDVAVVRAGLEGAICVLGSATPSLESWRNATELKKYTLLRMTHRVGQSSLPGVTLCDMNHERTQSGALPIFSERLIEAIKERLLRGEQTILFLNRRGYAPTVRCVACKETLTCERCSMKLTYHAKDDTLRCHSCGAWQRPPTQCPICGHSQFDRTGFGTQRVEQTLHAILPQARIIRMDADSTSRRHSHDELLNAFRAKEADILLGTQMIAKGLDFPNVTLVGILAADRSLDIAYDFRAAERTFQLIAQVSGRAGRGDLPGEVFVQTFQPDHPAIQAACRCAFENFANDELATRKEEGLPPYTRLAMLTFSAKDEKLVERVATEGALRLAKAPGLNVLPAMPAPMERKEDYWRWQVCLRAPTTKQITHACNIVFPADNRYTDELKIHLDIDAVFLG
ncbi:MAG: primosomal protein N' [bacterium]|nr:primosomal protein N' [bacterium]